MMLVDARRLTGPSYLSLAPLVIVELSLEPGDSVVRATEVFRAELDRMRAALGEPEVPAFVARTHEKGFLLGYEAPIDVMLPHAEMSEWAALSAIEILASRAPLPLEPKRTEIAAMLEGARSPALLALGAEAKRRGLPLLWDDEAVSVGAGRGAITFTPRAIPAAHAIDWSKVSTIPIALVTGTNGKTTSSRLLAHVAGAAGHVVGNTSTDAIVVGGEIVETGDWTGPHAARAVLRHPKVELAVLETARGGILRRGLAVASCDVALLTNVSDDHLGTYGVDDLAAMTRVKGVVAEIVAPTGAVVVNANDPHLVALARRVTREGATGRPRLVYFADLDAVGEPARSIVGAHVAAGGEAIVSRAGELVVLEGARASSLGRLEDLPITFGGAARYNVENVLGVVGAARALGVRDDVIAGALASFAVTDNPHRGQLLERAGVRVLLDFGHNPEAVRAVLRLVGALLARRPGRLFVVTGSPGDRSDREIEDIARAIHDASPARVFVRELGDYLRGRAPGEVPAIFRRAFAASGLSPDAFELVDTEVAALERAFAEAREGDVVAVLVHIEREAVRALLEG